MAFALFQEIAELSDKLVEQSADHETRSQDFESKVRDVRDNLESRVGDLQRSLELVRNAKCELERKAEKLRELLEERDTSIKVRHSCFSMSLSFYVSVCLLSIFFLSICLYFFLCLSICLNICVCVYQNNFSSWLFVYLPICLSVYRPHCLSVFLAICVICLSV
jgi:hypothetical protein